MYSSSETLFAGQLIYQAQSPDEGALVSAARNFGFVFRVSSAFRPNKFSCVVYVSDLS